MGAAISSYSYYWSSIFDRLVGTNKEYRIVMLGLDSAGKTTLLYRLKLGEVQHTVPTIGFNVESVEYRNISFLVWDVGGQEKLRMLWRHYYESAKGLIFVVDSADVDRIAIARKELSKLAAAEELKGATILIFANKQDLPGAMNAQEVAKELNLREMLIHHQWYIQPCIATDGKGLHQGLDWLSSTLSQKKFP
jgi:small GTP-binding protein